jgi:uncharacterized protein YjiS (DUF1127 family)
MRQMQCCDATWPMVDWRDPPIFPPREAGDVPSSGVRRRNKETRMYTYTEAELLRVARVRTDPVSTQRMIDLSEANRLAAQARAETALAAMRAVGRFMGGIVRKVAAWRRYRAGIAELQALDARTLSDIGISRADIPAVAAGLWMPQGRQATTATVPSLPGNENARQAAA